MLQKLFEVFIVFLRLGLTSFGGPIAHLGYFHDEFVIQKKWISDHAYAEIVTLCQFLPGPASSQVGMSIGLSRAGILGAIVAWVGFTIPSAIFMILFGLGIAKFETGTLSPWLHGLKIAAVAVVAQAIWSMAIKLCPDKQRATIAILSAAIVTFFASSWMQVFAIGLGGVLGLIFLRKNQELPHASIQIQISQKLGTTFLVVFAMILFLLPILVKSLNSSYLQMFDSFFRAGSLVFGGGHVVLPLLQAEVVPSGFVSKELFMAGYGAAQAIPGPLFSFSAFLGAVSAATPNGWIGGFYCLIAAFLPSFLLIIGILPYWEKLRKLSAIRFAMLGINAVVVGLLLGAFYDPVWTSAIFTAKDFVIALVLFLFLMFWRLPSWAVVGVGLLVGRFLI